MNRPTLLRPTLLRDDSGTAAVEFALVGPMFLLLIMATLMMGLLLFSATSLESAVQGAARCAAILGKPCANPERRYQGMTDTPAFTAQARTCGQLVTAQTIFKLDLIVWREDVPLSASACA